MAGVLALALAPLLRVPAQARALHLLRAGATAFALAGLYFTLHGLLQGWVAPADALPAAPWWLLVGASFAALFVLQTVLAAHAGGPLAARLYPWFYGGLFLDQIFSRFMFRHWPPPRAARPDPA
jgi:NAD(P)H-quinone oxidoreductase subunit 5